ncbi:LysM peptidoglycan-binding domain-containing protein [Phyllobacterium sp. 21LDTY02-6]|uniref:LysM peptidoglycan-binding domain-containing protein n=1 Tax=Phyllobacterium sp. 21LDTY02-6 TaxID=2944903 RepID=UPI002021B35A|nr:LysM peptidoglycan-binding domain-containing protein [Phyllobacterium sp. 21LDTY02-6]MCO4319772.1 LysM peptidoglycan-binding domain-containing protein [Phyllobacterium sp. 21LDTY02-6]
MASSRYLLWGFGAVVAAGLVAVYSGYLPGTNTQPQPASVASQPAPEKPSASAVAKTPPAAPAAEGAQTSTQTPAAAQAPASGEPAATNQAATPGAPTFDILRVEPNGSIVIAGRAGKDATVDLLLKGEVIGTTKSSANGDFVIALDEPLEPGDYQLVLRSTGADGTAMTSVETAIVSVPESESGQVLALVEQSGQPSRMITKPQAKEKPAAETVVASTAKGEQPAPPAAVKARISVEAVEIEGNKIFVAGNAEPGATVKVYANSDVLGSTAATQEGRFLVQTVRELEVGDYIIRADMLAKDGVTVVARAAVPFRRDAGDRVSAVAPTPATGEQPAAAAGDAQAAADAGAPLRPVDGSVIIRRGDNLWRISRRTYGEGMRYTTIYLANKEQIRNPDMIYPGQVFNLPEKATQTQ